mmetsp:Transcript_102156/g.304931  ORF Transcript_102156/g.304931 Transcript_102156/m.304931 type:complete len:305 (+) Transcript_102156:14-928(+)
MHAGMPSRMPSASAKARRRPLNRRSPRSGRGGGTTRLSSLPWTDRAGESAAPAVVAVRAGQEHRRPNRCCWDRRPRPCCEGPTRSRTARRCCPCPGLGLGPGPGPGLGPGLGTGNGRGPGPDPGPGPSPGPSPGPGRRPRCRGNSCARSKSDRASCCGGSSVSSSAWGPSSSRPPRVSAGAACGCPSSGCCVATRGCGARSTSPGCPRPASRRPRGRTRASARAAPPLPPWPHRLGDPAPSSAHSHRGARSEGSPRGRVPWSCDKAPGRTPTQRQKTPGSTGASGSFWAPTSSPTSTLRIPGGT